MKLLESGSLQRMIFMSVIFIGGALVYVWWVSHGGGLPPTILQSFAIIMLSIAYILDVRALQKQIQALKSQLAAKQ